MDAVDQANLVKRGEVTPLELLDAAIERIERIDPELNAVTIRWFDHARDTARSELPDGPFRGVPFLIKDLFAGYAGQPITNGNRALKNAGTISDADTTLVSRFRDVGLVTAGRTNSPELGSVPTTEPLAWGATHNPWDRHSFARRIERRRRRRRRQRHGRGRARQRRRRLDSHPRVVLRAGRPETQPGPNLAGPDPRRDGAVGGAVRQPHRA